ncbi:MAG: bifunctional hydroxymethylpyrimidine kinase/phosphomethylpyrimidine kinase [Sandaracinus sp.]|nr:bifunctional hydroxymethylpyrimidine kinase/phosphomethylpyrimidine kinase [Sandaracinus sp.]MCB9610884.1 bifunctional hydroxymethylpyrimidine kinase/phosphomethylpyrimidine kinase [Sandaracinus sp.]MCB9619452.1 bifunctional hydroxymethylpyrimidine kinase/phosphomethylpyrimidine kinase [Sandaracinus sp.]MCB9625259.1 bifunctional hydroxymethylpyrimidine kinase/phosphomethylpyrimidine kinase [Sandaracinus sp.]MCB9634917.1 bifunctional hydroxymethylpyrimidine kinase/phosphomethylpyrimidine kina
MPVVALTIAGSDPSGGAGIQADLKTFHQHGVYGTSVITLLTVQNTQRVSRVEVMGADLVREQLEAVVEDVPPRAAKTGALGSAEVLLAVAEAAAGFAFPLVVDPVMISKHGASLMGDEARAAFGALLRVATVVTPNAHEAAALTGRKVERVAEGEDAGRALLDLGARAVVVKGGHLDGDDAVDLLITPDGIERFVTPRIDTRHTHGTGCTFSAALTARLARGASLPEAVEGAKGWLTEALRTAGGIGGGIGPVNHFVSAGAEVK